MRHFIILLTALVSINSFAIKSRRIVPSIGSPFPAEYSKTDDQSRVLSELPSIYDHVMINNTQPVEIACVVDAVPAPSDTVTAVKMFGKEIYIPAGQGYVFDDLRIAPDVYCRSMSGSARTSSEPIIVEVW